MTEIANIYASIKSLNYDHTVENIKDGYVILQPHQIVPKYYLFSNPSHRSLILNYSTGAGKTITGLFCILDRLYMAKINENYPSLFIPKAIVVGEWMTSTQFKVDMSRKMFGLINNKYLEELDKATTSAEKEDIEMKIQRSMNRIVTFYGYQSLFNALFPAYSERHIQDINVLIRDYENNRLQVNTDLLDTMRDNVIVVDEMQKLYSQSGINTYGFTLAYLSRMSVELNLRIVYMSGTIFNSSVSEISSIVNLVTESGKFYAADDFTTQIKVLDDLFLYRLKPNKDKEIADMLSSKYIYYSRNTIAGETHKTTKGDLIYLETINSSNYPIEIRIGNVMIDNKTVLYQLHAQKYQLSALKGAVVEELGEDENERQLSPYDVGLPPENEWKKNGIEKDSAGLFTGSFLLEKNIKDYSIIGYKILELCKENAANNEKTVLYHNKLNNFGLLQYGKILEVNGFLKRGKEPIEITVCRNCGNTYGKHGNSCKRFQPIYFEFLHGQQKPTERQYIVNQVYNSPNNLYGELISILLISDVAYAGVSLMNTNHLAILSRVSNMSRVTQIQARIVRMKSHVSLPKDKRYAKLYIFGAATEMNEKSSIYKYYKLRSMADEDIKALTATITDASIGKVLINTPEKYKITKEEVALTSEMAFDDGKRILENISNIVIRSLHFNWWRLDALVERVRSNTISVAYLDLSLFPPDYVRKYIIEDEEIEVFKVDLNKTDDNLYVRAIEKEPIDMLERNKLYFEDIHSDYTETIENYITTMQESSSFNKKHIFFTKLMQLLTLINDYSRLKDFKYFWEYVYLIGNEYYADDETNFIVNHSSKNRKQSKVEGCYWNNHIILKDGTTKQITVTFVTSTGQKEINRTYHISASIGLHILIFNTDKATTKEDDLRAVQRGTDCWSHKDSKSMKHYNVTPKNILEHCAELIAKVCEDQSKNTKDKFVVTPFETDLTF